MTEPRNDGKENGSKMTNIELQKKANEVRKGIVTSVHSAKAGHPGVLCLRRIFLLICILRK